MIKKKHYCALATIFILLLLFLILVSFKFPLISLLIGSFLLIMIIILTSESYYLSVFFSMILLIIPAIFNTGKISYIIFIGVFILLLFSNQINFDNFFLKDGFLLFFMLWVIVSSIQYYLHIDEIGSKSNLYAILFGFIVIIIMLNIVDNYTKLDLFYKVWGICLLISIFIGLWEIFTGNHIRQELAHSYGTFATVGFYNANNYSFLLAISIPIIFYFLMNRLVYKIIGLFMYISILFIVYTNGTRTVIPILLIVSLVFVFKIMRQKYFKLTLFSIGIIIVISMSNYSYLLQAYEKVSTINMEDASTNTRIELSKSGFEIFKENMLFGVGPGNVKNYMPNVGDSVHNFWIEVMADHGIIIFLILLWFFLKNIFLYIKRTSKLTQLYTWPVFWMVLIFIPASFAPSTIVSFEVLWVYLGLMASVNIINKGGKSITRYS